jgi:hypothetical protein
MFSACSGKGCSTPPALYQNVLRPYPAAHYVLKSCISCSGDGQPDHSSPAGISDEELPAALGSVSLVPQLKEPASTVAWSTMDVDDSGKSQGEELM